MLSAAGTLLSLFHGEFRAAPGISAWNRPGPAMLSPRSTFHPHADGGSTRRNMRARENAGIHPIRPELPTRPACLDAEALETRRSGPAADGKAPRRP